MSQPSAKQQYRLLRFRDRLRELLLRKQAAAAGLTSAKTSTTKTNPTILPNTEADRAHTITGSARSQNGATAPWLMLSAERSYQLYIPPQANTRNKRPLVVMIHGCHQTADDFARGTRMNRLADAYDFNVLYPEQTSIANLRRCWNWFEPNTAAGHGECAIILEAIAAAHKHTAIDDRRVYVAGLSSGGALAGLLAYHYPHIFAAAAMHSGLPPLPPASTAAAMLAMEKGIRVNPQALAENYWNTHEILPPALLVLHGDEDKRVTQRNATATIRVWHTLWENAPQVAPLISKNNNHNASTGQRGISRTEWQSDDRVVISGLRIHGLAHAWSGGDASLPYFDSKGPDATSLVWRFFAQHARSPEAIREVLANNKKLKSSKVAGTPPVS